jgi:hypothetical protein
MASSADRVRALPRRFGLILLGICLIGVPTSARAANNCAWINEATASGLLGGEAVGDVTAADGQPTVCTFTQTSAGVKRTLRLTVEISTDAHARVGVIAQSCGPDAAPIKAIGNEALVCAADDRKAGLGELVVGRVRDQVFTITIGSSLKNDPILKRDALKARIYTAAEQVAGNLF